MARSKSPTPKSTLANQQQGELFSTSDAATAPAPVVPETSAPTTTTCFTAISAPAPDDLALNVIDRLADRRPEMFVKVVDAFEKASRAHRNRKLAHPYFHIAQFMLTPHTYTLPRISRPLQQQLHQGAYALNNTNELTTRGMDVAGHRHHKVMDYILPLALEAAWNGALKGPQDDPDLLQRIEDRSFVWEERHDKLKKHYAHLKQELPSRK